MIKFAVVGHHSRRDSAQRLTTLLGGELFLDEGSNGSTWNHKRALVWAEQQEERVVIIEDDAIPTRQLASIANLWIKRFPEHLISFYLGTSRPPQWQPIVTKYTTEADAVGRDHILLPKLIHGVCYSVPKKDIPGVLEKMDLKDVADFSIGDAWMKVSKKEVLYPTYSLVEHEDGERCEETRDGVIDRKVRKARRLNGPLLW